MKRFVSVLLVLSGLFTTVSAWSEVTGETEFLSAVERLNALIVRVEATMDTYFGRITVVSSSKAQNTLDKLKKGGLSDTEYYVIPYAVAKDGKFEVNFGSESRWFQKTNKAGRYTDGLITFDYFANSGQLPSTKIPVCMVMSTEGVGVMMMPLSDFTLLLNTQCADLEGKMKIAGY